MDWTPPPPLACSTDSCTNATKTLYVKDQQLWEKAIRLAGHQGLSGVVTQLLAKWVADKEKQKAIKSSKNQLMEVELWVGGEEHLRWHRRDPLAGDYKVTFTGRLLASTETEYPMGIDPTVEVYQMSNKQLAVYRNYRSEFAALSPQSQEKYGAACLAYSDFETLCRDPEALETQWDITQEDEMQMAGVAPYATRTQKEESITSMALAASQLQQVDDAWKRKGQEKEIVKEFLLAPVGSAVFTEEEIDLCYEEAKREAYDFRFQKSIAGALGAELIVRIDQPL